MTDNKAVIYTSAVAAIDADDMPKDFVFWVVSGASSVTAGTRWDSELVRSHLTTWQAATERATAVERERCASAIKRESDKTVSMAVLCGVEAVDLRPYEICEAAIVKGGDT